MNDARFDDEPRDLRQQAARGNIIASSCTRQIDDRWLGQLRYQRLNGQFPGALDRIKYHAERIGDGTPSHK